VPPSSTHIDREFFDAAGELAVDALFVSKATENGPRRFRNVVAAKSYAPSAPPPAFSTPQRVVDMIQLALSREIAVAFELLRLQPAELINDRVRSLLKIMTLNRAKQLAISRLLILRQAKLTLPAELMVQVLVQFLPPPAWNVGVDGGPGPYSHPDFPAEFKLGRSLPPFEFDITPGWRFSTNDVYGWDDSLTICPIHAVDDADLDLLAAEYYSSRRPFVWSGFVGGILQQNVFGSERFDPVEAMGKRLGKGVEVGFSYTIPLEAGMLDTVDEASYAGDILDMLDPEAINAAKLSITVKLLIDPLRDRLPRNEKIDVEEVLTVMDHVIASLEAYWCHNYTDESVRLARAKVQLRFWPVTNGFANFTGDGHWWAVFDEVHWEDLQKRVKETTDQAQRAEAQAWLAFAMEDTLDGWKKRLESPERASMVSQSLRAILEMDASASLSTRCRYWIGVSRADPAACGMRAPLCA
jgi:hypothetical protein